MTQTLRRIGILAAAALLATALGLKPVYAIGTDDPPPPTETAARRKERQEEEPHQAAQESKATNNRTPTSSRNIAPRAP